MTSTLDKPRPRFPRRLTATEIERVLRDESRRLEVRATVLGRFGIRVER